MYGIHKLTASIKKRNVCDEVNNPRSLHPPFPELENPMRIITFVALLAFLLSSVVYAADKKAPNNSAAKAEEIRPKIREHRYKNTVCTEFYNPGRPNTFQFYTTHLDELGKVALTDCVKALTKKPFAPYEMLALQMSNAPFEGKVGEEIVCGIVTPLWMPKLFFLSHYASAEFGDEDTEKCFEMAFKQLKATEGPGSAPSTTLRPAGVSRTFPINL